MKDLIKKNDKKPDIISIILWLLVTISVIVIYANNYFYSIDIVGLIASCIGLITFISAIIYDNKTK